MPALLPDVDPDGLLEYSVVYTDRAVNHMSHAFQEVMRDLSRGLCGVYGAEALAIVPGSGTFGMEAVARQLATDRRTLVLRTGWFSYRWTQIFEAGGIPATAEVLVSKRLGDGPQAPFEAPPLDQVRATIAQQRPEVVFAAHVETSTGLMLPDGYLEAVAEATHAVGGLFVLDCIASGAMWVDMAAVGVDVLLSAPQKGWTGPPCAGLVLLGPAGLAAVDASTSSSFAIDLRRWLGIMRAYEGGGHAYHATMPTDALRTFRDVLQEAEGHGFALLKERQLELGRRIRSRLADAGYPSVAAHGYEAPGVVVSYTDDPEMKAGRAFAAAGVQIAAGVPLACGEGDAFSTFRVGLFGLDKLLDVDGTVARFSAALEAIARGASKG